jgi:hypothetical protein
MARLNPFKKLKGIRDGIREAKPDPTLPLLKEIEEKNDQILQLKIRNSLLKRDRSILIGVNCLMVIIIITFIYFNI